MVKYNFTIDDLENRLKELQKNYYKEKNYFIKQDIIYDINLLREEIDKYYNHDYNDISLINLYQNCKEINKPYFYLYNEFKDFFNILRNRDLNLPNLKNSYFTNDDLFDIANDFYTYLGHPFYGYFQKLYRQRRKHINFISYNDNEIYGNTLFLRYNNEAYITIKKVNNLEDTSTLIHEIGHVISAYMNHNFICSHYCEVDTITYELLFMDFIYDKYHNSDALLLKANILNSAINASDEIVNINKLATYEKMNSLFTKNKTLKAYASVICDYNSLDFETILKDYREDKILSLIGTLFAIELYYKFKEDFNLGEYYLKKIINLNANTNEQLFNHIKRFGFIPNLHIKEFENDVYDPVRRITKWQK